jgi:uncharacterized protein involved in response to NO
MHFKQSIKQNYFFSQPHQPFFLTGIINALIAMVIFLLSYKGVVALHMPIRDFHVYSLVYLVFTNVFAGFLFTTFPRFNRTEPIKQTYYTKLFYINLMGIILFFTGIFSSTIILGLSMGILCIVQIFIMLKLLDIYKSSTMQNKTDSFWILIAGFFGVSAHIFFIVGLYLPVLNKTAILCAFYLYLLFLAFSVAQRMIPFFSHSISSKNENFPKYVFVLLVFKTIFSISSVAYLETVTDVILSFYIAKEFLRWGLKPFDSPAILWILHLAFFWLPLGFMLSAITLVIQKTLGVNFYFLNIHLLALGFLTTVLIGFGTRVILGHSGQVPTADKTTSYLFYFTQIVVLGRVLLSINIALGLNLGFLFDISVTLWILLFTVWIFKFGKILITGR